MSNLDYPISLLVIKLSKLSQPDAVTVFPPPPKVLKEKAGRLNALNRAINILRDKKLEDEIGEREKEEEEKDSDKNIKL